jgi:hypothetical protein
MTSNAAGNLVKVATINFLLYKKAAGWGIRQPYNMIYPMAKNLSLCGL